MAVKTYVCCGCGSQYKGEKPAQCSSCGRMDFIYFDSNGEAKKWAELQLLEKAGVIRNLQRQISFPLMAHRADGLGVKVGTYIADYVFERDGEIVIADYKSLVTPEAALKLRWMQAMGMPVEVITEKRTFRK